MSATHSATSFTDVPRQILAVFMCFLVIATPAEALLIVHEPTPVRVFEDITAQVSWKTDLPATGKVQYGTSRQVLSIVTQNMSLSNDHIVTLTGLAPLTEYFFQISSTDENGTTIVDNNGGGLYSFMTPNKLVDAKAPIITEIALSDLTNNSTTVAWKTDEPATSEVRYAQASGGAETLVNNTGRNLSHKVLLDTVKNKKYTYTLRSCDAAMNCQQTPPDTFIAGPPQTARSINASVLASVRDTVMAIDGRAPPNSRVSALVNGERQRVYPTKEDGSFVFTALRLAVGDNNITLEAEEDGSDTITQQYVVSVDTIPPNLLVDIPSVVTQSPVSAKLNVSKPVTLYYSVQTGTDVLPPKAVEGLTAKVEGEVVIISWTTTADVAEYAVYRDDVRIVTTSQAEYSDTTASPGMEHTYAVRPVNKYCREGNGGMTVRVVAPRLTSASPLNAAQSLSQGQSVNLTCAPREQELNIATPGPASFDLALVEGKNTVVMRAVDAAGHELTRKIEVLVDTQAPRILDTNLAQLSPTYIPKVSIKGHVSEPATILAYIGKDTKPSGRALTGPDGSFSVDIELRRDAQVSLGKKQASLETGQAWSNQVRLEAIDIAGHKATEGPTEIKYALCGYGTWYNVQIGQSIPDLMNPRLILDGMQQVGFTLDLTYTGGLNSTLSPEGGVKLRVLDVSGEVAGEYDNQWASPMPIMLKKKKDNQYAGYANIVISNPEPIPEDDNRTMYERELNISQHRKGKCLLPGLGCIKLFLELELSFQESRARGKAQDPNRETVKSKDEVTSYTQRVCVPLEVAIDKRVPPDLLPKGFLKTTVEFLDSAISAIDVVLKPITTVGTYLLYACLAGNGVLYATYFKERLACDFSSAIQKAFPEGGWNKEIAETGLCNEVYEKDQQRTSCNACSAAIKFRKSFEDKFMHGLCDRVGCPSAPTFMSHIRNQQAELRPLRIQDDVIKQKVVQKHPFLQQAELKSRLPEKFKDRAQYQSAVGFAGSDCAFAIERGYGDKSDAFTVAGQYSLFKQAGSKSPLRIGETTLPAIDCSELHPANPYCCSTEYMRQWGPACGFSTGNGDTFNELKESTCLAAQKLPEGPRKFETDFGQSCNRFWNSAAGFCDPKTGKPLPEIIATGYQYAVPGGREATSVSDDDLVKHTRTEYLNSIGMNGKDGPLSPAQEEDLARRTELALSTKNSRILSSARNRDMFVQVVPHFSSGKEVESYEVWRGYVHDRFLFEQQAGVVDGKDGKPNQNDQDIFNRMQAKQDESGGRWYLNSKLDFFQDVQIPVSVFGKDLGDLKKGGARVIAPNTQEAQINELALYLCTGPVDNAELCRSDRANLKRIYERVRAVMTESDQEYIVDPTKGFLRSVQCVCLPAVTSYLEQWRAIMGHMRTCFKTILVTGDGSAGVCRGLLSKYVCDLLYEVIACFANKYSSVGAGTRGGIGSGISNVFGALSSAGSDVGRSVRGRYGNTPFYNTVFAERKLLHSTCMFAFTGEWDLDVAAMFKQTADSMPIETQAAFPICERRFQGFDTSTDPSGLSTWVYRLGFAVAAGADLTYDVQLRCSSGPKCSEAEGFKNGMCDCPKKESIISVYHSDLTGRLKKNEILDKEFPYIVGSNGDPNQEYRYDTAIIKWKYENAKTQQLSEGEATCPINQVGGSPPGFCAFDTFSLKFRCAFVYGLEGIGFKGASAVFPELRAWSADAARSTTCRNVYGLGDIPAFDVRVRQETSEDPRKTDENQKFLRVVIKNQYGVPIAAQPLLQEGDYVSFKSKNQILKNQGEYPVPVKVDESGGIISEQIQVPGLKEGIKAEHFMLGAPAQLQAIQGVTGSVFENSRWTLDWTRFINLKKLTLSDGTKPTKATGLIVKITGQSPGAGSAKGDVAFFETSIDPTTAAQVDEDKLIPLQMRAQFSGSGVIGRTGVSGGTVDTILSSSASGSALDLYAVSLDVLKLPAGSSAYVYLHYVPQASVQSGQVNSPPANQCPPDSQPQEWTAEFTIYDADKFGSPTEQVSMNPATGDAAKSEVKFLAVCAQPPGNSVTSDKIGRCEYKGPATPGQLANACTAQGGQCGYTQDECKNTGGTVMPASDCGTTACCKITAVCGNGKVEQGEICDADNSGKPIINLDVRPDPKHLFFTNSNSASSVSNGIWVALGFTPKDKSFGLISTAGQKAEFIYRVDSIEELCRQLAGDKCTNSAIRLEVPNACEKCVKFTPTLHCSSGPTASFDGSGTAELESLWKGPVFSVNPFTKQISVENTFTLESDPSSGCVASPQIKKGEKRTIGAS